VAEFNCYLIHGVVILTYTVTVSSERISPKALTRY
jgi:hypothetical protein